MHRTANAAIVKTIRGFESLTFRNRAWNRQMARVPPADGNPNYRESGGSQVALK